MQVAWRWTNGRLAEAPVPPLPSRLDAAGGLPVSGVAPGRVEGLGCKGCVGWVWGGVLSPRDAEGLSRDERATRIVFS